MSTLLDLISTTAVELGLAEIGLVVTSQDAQVKQLLALANREGREQVAMNWPQLQKTQTITLVNGQASYAFPSDFAAYIPDTIWNPAMRWPVAGPISPQGWQFLKSGLINTQPWMRFRIMAGAIFFDPTPTSTNAGQTVTIEYQSNRFCSSATGVAQTKWTNDSDTFLLPDDVLVLGVKWRWLAAKRMDYSEEKKAWSDCMDREVARSFVGRSLPLNHMAADGWGQGSIQDGDFPGR